MPRPGNAGWAGTSDGVAARGFVNGRDLPRSGGRESTAGAHRSEVPARRQSRPRNTAPARRQSRPREYGPCPKADSDAEYGPCPQADSDAGTRSLPAGRLGRGNTVPARRQSRQRERPPARMQPSPKESPAGSLSPGNPPQAESAAEQKQLAAAQPLGEGCDEIAENGHAKGRDKKVGSFQHNGIGLDDEIAGHGN